MPYETTEIAGVHLFRPKVFVDSRGHFFESFRQDLILEETGLDFSVAQVNNSLSARGVLRGIHFKRNPPGQAKFVSVITGAIIDVALDLRKSSPTFGKWQAFELSAENRNSLLIGYGIGHAFLALEDRTQVVYLCDSVFEPRLEHSINPLSAGINWNNLGEKHSFSSFSVSEKDMLAPSFSQAEHLFFD